VRIRHVSIRNFRGIRQLDWAVPDRSLFCLIGRGDSTKSTILDAIRFAFYPQWNLSFDDADFHQCRPANAIRVEVVLGDLPDAFRDLASYGHSLCGWNATTSCRHDEPGEGLEDALRVRFSVGDDLEPSWRIVKGDEDEGAAFTTTDRAKVSASLIGVLSDRHLTWSRGSLLSNLTGAETLALTLAQAGRAAKAALDDHRAQDLAPFDAVAQQAEVTARSLGVNVASVYKAHLDADAVSVQLGGLALHDGDIPLRRLGLGSRRMLTTGLQKRALPNPHITLFDEVEIGLEPHRIARLVEHLKTDTAGQYFVTTHSPVVLRELTVDDLHIVHCHHGDTQIVAANKPGIADRVQGKIRSGAEAFLAPKIIVCEGATEAGFLRGLDDRWIARGMSSFAYQGVALFDAGCGGQVRPVAESLRGLAYSVAVLADSDVAAEFSAADAAALEAQGVAVTLWSDGMSIEQRVFADLAWAGVIASFEAACAIQQDRSRLIDQIQTRYGTGFCRDPTQWADEPRLRTALGAAAKGGGWFKRQDRAQEWVAALDRHLDEPSVQATDLLTRIVALRAWIDNA
jgi:hypothetical protein